MTTDLAIDILAGIGAWFVAAVIIGMAFVAIAAAIDAGGKHDEDHGVVEDRKPPDVLGSAAPSWSTSPRRKTAAPMDLTWNP